MKLRHLLTLFVLLACLIISSPAFAISGIDPIGIDPIVIGPPPIMLDPCFFADFVGDMGPLDIFVVASDLPHYVAVYSYDISQSATTVAHVITNYSRIAFESSFNVAMNDTVIDLVDEMTLFGRSVNRNMTGIIGAEGVIVGAVDFNGNALAVKGSYITTDFGGSNRICAFLQ